MAFDYRDKIEYNRGIHHIRNYMDDDIVLFRNPKVRRDVKHKRMDNNTYDEVTTKEIDGNKQYRNDYPAAVVLCCLSSNKLKDCNMPEFFYGESGDPYGESTYKNKKYLSEIKQVLGEIGSKIKGCKNTVGRCAEQHAAKLLLDKHSRYSRKAVVFSSAFRPRTDEVIPYCENCKKLFEL